jgi:hypothetical protein
MPTVASGAEQRPVEKQVTSNFPSPAESSYAKATAVAEQALDAGRIEAIRKGTFPKGAAKGELIAALGEPDRIYKSRGYEQYVYFDKKPGRVWFIGNWLVQTSE